MRIVTRHTSGAAEYTGACQRETAVRGKPPWTQDTSFLSEAKSPHYLKTPNELDTIDLNSNLDVMAIVRAWGGRVGAGVELWPRKCSFDLGFCFGLLKVTAAHNCSKLGYVSRYIRPGGKGADYHRETIKVGLVREK